MLKQVKDLTPGDVIRLEYGMYDNFVDFLVDEVALERNGYKVKCHRGCVEEQFTFRVEEEVEVLKHV